jgi:thiamine phosphate synthase YjbQ (UPF0047 family)
MPSTEVHLELTPTRRRDLIDLTATMSPDERDGIARHRKAVYCSYHTTAGYLDQSLCLRLNHRPDLLDSLFGAWESLFPPGADYEHDKMDLRRELSVEQRRKEPRNADSHLAFIGSGLRNCVTYDNRHVTHARFREEPRQGATEPHPAPVFFIDLDGVHEHGRRTRRTTALGYDTEETVYSDRMPVPVSGHPIDSINLRDERLGFFGQLREIVRRAGVKHGRIDISLAGDERNAGLTVNEYETLLMQHDLREVLKNPVRFMADRGRSILRQPRAIPGKTLNYAKYDMVNALNEVMDAIGVSESIVERIVARFMAVPAARFLRMKRNVSMLIGSGDAGAEPEGSIVHGVYQSPILVQWKKARSGARHLDVNIVRFR